MNQKAETLLVSLNLFEEVQREDGLVPMDLKIELTKGCFQIEDIRNQLYKAEYFHKQIQTSSGTIDGFQETSNP